MVSLRALAAVALAAGIAGGMLALGAEPLLRPPPGLPAPPAPPPLNLSGNITLEELVEAAYQRVAPSVIHITTTVVRSTLFGPSESTGQGSGVVINATGLLLTNYHVVQGASRIEVNLTSGRRAGAQVVGSDPERDIAVLRVVARPEELPAAPLGNSSDLRVGQSVMAIGNPFGLDRTVTLGIVSALNRSLDAEDGTVLNGLIQTDASINPGNSGGPLVNLRGEVVGINTAILSPSGGNIGIGFAIPVDEARRVADSIQERAREAGPPRAWLGVSGTTVDAALVRLLRLPVAQGVLLIEVVPGSPADRAGLRGGDTTLILNNRVLLVGGDILLEADGKPLKSMDDLAALIGSKRPGEEMALTFLRDSDRRTVAVTLGTRPA
ncbi:MAG: trypsin-like peptidase domain-containing protein [Halobacteria archaeon]